MIAVGGEITEIGVVKLQILSNDLRLDLYVDFLVLKQPMPPFLYMQDMIQNDLDISIQKRLVSYGNRSQKRTLENFFLTHRWSRTDMDFICYTEETLRRIIKAFGHPSIQSMTSLIRRAS